MNVEAIFEAEKSDEHDWVCIREFWKLVFGIAMKNKTPVLITIGHNRRGRAASKADLIVHVQ